MHQRGVATILLALLSAVALMAEAANLYRYRNHEGNLVIDYTVPPEYVPAGYEILSESGRVIDVVAPQQDPEVLGSEEEQLRKSEQEALQLKEDQMLLRTYSEVAELESAMARRLQQLEREIEIIESNLSKNAAAFDASRTKAANYQFGGRAIPKSLLENMDDQIRERQGAEQMLVVRRQEYQGTKDRYLGYLARFRALKGISVPGSQSSSQQAPEKSPSLPLTTDPASVQ